MIDKKFLEQQLQGLQTRHEQSLRNTEQLLGAIMYTQMLLKKLEEDQQAEAAPPPEG